MTANGQKETLFVIRFSSFEKTKAKNGAGYSSVSVDSQRMTNNEPRITNVSYDSTTDARLLISSTRWLKICVFPCC